MSSIQVPGCLDEACRMLTLFATRLLEKLGIRFGQREDATVNLWTTLRRMTCLERSQAFVVALHLLLAFGDLRSGSYLNWNSYRHPEHLAIVCSYFLFLFYLDLGLLVTLLTFPNQAQSRLSLWLTVQWLSLGVTAFATESLGAPFSPPPGVPLAPVQLLLSLATPSSLQKVARWGYMAAILACYTYILGRNSRLDFLMRVPDFNPVFNEDDFE